MFLNQKEFSNQAAVAAAAVSASSLQRGYNGQTNQTPNQYTSQTWNAYSGYYETGVPKPADPYQISPDALSYFTPLPPPASQPTSSTSAVSSTTSVSSPPTQTSTSLTTLTSVASAEHWNMVNNGFGVHNNNQGTTNNHHFSAFTASNTSQTHNAYGKPYRPWGGAEMAC